MLIARPHSLQVHAGINKLLMAEKEATEVVKAAKEGERPLRLRSIYRCAQPQSPCEASQHTAPSCSPAHGRRSLTNAHPRDRNTDPRATAAVPRPATRAEKVARLKLAKAEAERDIEAYKATREAQFQVFSKERMGDTGSYSKGLAKATEEELAAIAKSVTDNKAGVIDLLLKSVKTVSA
jgi:V-type H+-transporting ATPase subunit G